MKIRARRLRRRRRRTGATFVEYGSGLCFVSIIAALSFQFVGQVGHVGPTPFTTTQNTGFCAVIANAFSSVTGQLNNVSSGAGQAGSGGNSLP